MTVAEKTLVRPQRPFTRAASRPRTLTFGRDTAFQLALRQRVAEYFDRTGRRERDCWQMYAKTAILLAGFALSYVLLVSWPGPGSRAGSWPSCSVSLPPGSVSTSSTTVDIEPIRLIPGSTGSWP